MKKAHTPTSNISKEEQKAMKELRNNNTRVILTADKGMSMVVMDRDEYIRKAEELLSQPTYKTIPADTTTKYKNKLITLLKIIKAEGGINEATYRRLYPTGTRSPKFYGLPKVHKEGMPLRPIVSSREAVCYETAKELARILKPLVGRSPYCVHNTKDFIQLIRCIQLHPDECIMSYDVKALLTSVHIEPAINIIKKHLEQDKELQQRTSMTVSHIICLLEVCMRNTYYEKLEGAAMGSPISPIVANLYMEAFEINAFNTSPHPPSQWEKICR